MPKFDKYITLLNTTRTTTGTTYASTADRNPIWRYDSGDYDQVAGIYFEACMRATSGDTSYMNLRNFTDGADITGSEVSTTSTVNVLVRSGDISGNLTTAKDYITRWKKSGVAGTSSFDKAVVIISQNGAITKTVTVIDIGERLNVTASYTAPTDYHIFQYDSGMFDGTVSIYYEADLHCNASGNTTYSQLYDITSAGAVSSSEVTHTGNTTMTRKRSGAITLTNGNSYRMDVKGSTTADDVGGGKILIVQTGTITKTASYIPVVNTVSSGTNTTYTAQTRLVDFDASSFDANTTKNFYYEATLKASANTAYSQLYNVTDASQLAELSTASTSYVRQRSTALTMPTDDNNSLDNYRKIATSGTVTHGRTFIIAELVWTNANNLTLLGVGT